MPTKEPFQTAFFMKTSAGLKASPYSTDKKTGGETPCLVIDILPQASIIFCTPLQQNPIPNLTTPKAFSIPP